MSGLTRAHYQRYKQALMAGAQPAHNTLLRLVGGNARQLAVAQKRLAFELRQARESNRRLAARLCMEVDDMQQQYVQSSGALAEAKAWSRDDHKGIQHLNKLLQLQVENDTILKNLLPLLEDVDWEAAQSLAESLTLECPICLTEPEVDSLGYTSCCRKPGCIPCFTQWLAHSGGTCPLCRQSAIMIKVDTSDHERVDKVHMLRRYYCKEHVETALTHIGDDVDKDGTTWCCYTGLDYSKGFMARTFAHDDRKWMRDKKAWAIRHDKLDAFRAHVAQWDVVVP